MNLETMLKQDLCYFAGKSASCQDLHIDNFLIFKMNKKYRDIFYLNSGEHSRFNQILWAYNSVISLKVSLHQNTSKMMN